MTPTDLYRDCALSAWRIETLQHYAGTGDEERQCSFHAGEPLPPPGPGKQDDLALVTRLVDAGRTVGRIHIVDRPLTTDYLRYELVGYAESQAAGEEILITDRGASSELAELDDDFWLFDAGTQDAFALLMHYDTDGQYLGLRTSRPGDLTRCTGNQRTALQHAVSLNAYITAVRDPEYHQANRKREA